MNGYSRTISEAIFVGKTHFSRLVSRDSIMTGPLLSGNSEIRDSHIFRRPFSR